MKKSVEGRVSDTTSNKVLQVVLDLLEKDDGLPFEEKKKMACDFLRNSAREVRTDEVKATPVSELDVKGIKDRIWCFDDIPTDAENVYLRPVSENDRNDYIEIQKEYSAIKSMLTEESYCDTLWSEYTKDESLMCSIICDGTYIGYCGISNIKKHPWEIVIEIKSRWTKKGLAVIALKAMLNHFKYCLSVTEYRVRIDPSNFPSQKFFENFGATPNGITTLWIHDEKMLEQCEEDNMHLIDDNIIAVANKFSVEPRKLLSHVLEYSLNWK